MSQIDQKSYSTEFSFTQQDVKNFAALTGDNNPIHLDAEYAANTMFKKPIMHGMLSASIFSRVLGTSFPGEGTIYLSQSLKFLRPMFVEVPYRAEFRIENHKKDKHLAVISTQIVEVSTNKEVLAGEATVMNKNKL